MVSPTTRTVSSEQLLNSLRTVGQHLGALRTMPTAEKPQGDHVVLLWNEQLIKLETLLYTAQPKGNLIFQRGTSGDGKISLLVQAGSKASELSIAADGKISETTTLGATIECATVHPAFSQILIASLFGQEELGQPPVTGLWGDQVTSGAMAFIQCAVDRGTESCRAPLQTLDVALAARHAEVVQAGTQVTVRAQAPATVPIRTTPKRKPLDSVTLQWWKQAREFVVEARKAGADDDDIAQYEAMLADYERKVQPDGLWTRDEGRQKAQQTSSMWSALAKSGPVHRIVMGEGECRARDENIHECQYGAEGRRGTEITECKLGAYSVSRSQDFNTCMPKERPARY